MEEAFSQIEEKELYLPEGTRLFIRNLYGSTRLKTWNLQKILLTVSKHVSGNLSEKEAYQRLSHIKLEETRKENELGLYVSVPLFLFKPDVRITVDLELLAPPYINLKIDTGSQRFNGEIKVGNITSSYRDNLITRVSNTKGNFSIVSGPADIEIRDSEGKIVVESSSGKTIIRNTSGEIDVKSESGDIVLEKCNGSIFIRSKSGNVKLDRIEALSLDVKTSSGNIKVDINPIKGGNYKIESLSGQTELKLPYHSQSHIRLETKCGKIFSEPLFDLDARELKLEKSESYLEIRSTSGDICIIHELIGEERDGIANV